MVASATKILMETILFHRKAKHFWKHLNEIYHIENVFLYQLNPNDFDTVPQFVIEQCDRIINENSNLNNNTEIGEVN